MTKSVEYALFDGIPNFCPGCGKPITHEKRYVAPEYAGGVAMSCNRCELHYARIDTSALVTAAQAQGSDLS